MNRRNFIVGLFGATITFPFWSKSELKRKSAVFQFVAMDPRSNYTGTAYPNGIISRPVNNMKDALAIGKERGIKTIWELGPNHE